MAPSSSSPPAIEQPRFSTESWQLITAVQAASILGVTTVTVKRWANAGKVPYLLMPNGYRKFSRTWCEDWMRMNLHLTEQPSQGTD